MDKPKNSKVRRGEPAKSEVPLRKVGIATLAPVVPRGRDGIAALPPMTLFEHGAQQLLRALAGADPATALATAAAALETFTDTVLDREFGAQRSLDGRANQRRAQVKRRDEADAAETQLRVWCDANPRGKREKLDAWAERAHGALGLRLRNKAVGLRWVRERIGK